MYAFVILAQPKKISHRIRDFVDGLCGSNKGQPFPLTLRPSHPDPAILKTPLN